MMTRWLRHGQEVNQWYKRIISDPSILGDSCAEEWFKKYEAVDLSSYHLYHDIGKPYCIEYDEVGREHYPNHEELSALIYMEWTGETLNDRDPQLILNDMAFHKARGEAIKEAWALPYADHIYATSWASLEANAESFGGRESDSYKIKRKHLLKCLKRKPK